jgi:hypothetical protein
MIAEDYLFQLEKTKKNLVAVENVYKENLVTVENVYQNVSLFLFYILGIDSIWHYSNV